MSTLQKENTIILDMGSAKKDDIKDLQYGEGRLFKRIAKAISELKESGEIAENAQPVVVVVKKKNEKDF